MEIEFSELKTLKRVVVDCNGTERCKQPELNDVVKANKHKTFKPHHREKRRSLNFTNQDTID